jgi:hypothetical protein
MDRQQEDILTQRQQKDYYQMGRQGFAICVIVLGIVTLLFGDDKEFYGNYLFWSKYGFWENLGPMNAQSQSFFFYWKFTISLALIGSGLLMI